jgi:hypothetical protein
MLYAVAYLIGGEAAEREAFWEKYETFSLLDLTTKFTTPGIFLSPNMDVVLEVRNNISDHCLLEPLAGEVPVFAIKMHVIAVADTPGDKAVLSVNGGLKLDHSLVFAYLFLKDKSLLTLSLAGKGGDFMILHSLMQGKPTKESITDELKSLEVKLMEAIQCLQ